MKRKFGMFFILSVLVIILTIWGMKIGVEGKAGTPFISLGGNILYVGGSGANNYSKIQDAINDAIPGDTVFVYSGIYYENIVINKSINLVGENRDTTIIDGKNSGDVVKITADGVNISGFTICNCSIGIELYFSNNVSIANDNVTINGIGIYLYYSSNCTIINSSITCKNGIYLYYSCNDVIANSTISANLDYCIYLYYSINCIITNTTMLNNGIAICGKIEHWNSHTIDISNTVNGKPIYYWKNTNGGVIPLGAGQIILANCTNIVISNHSLSHATIGMEIGFSSNCTVTNNRVDSNSWYGIWLYYANNCTIINNTICHNGDALYLYSSNNCVITNNNVTINGIGVYLYHSHNCIINGSLFTENNGGIHSSFSNSCTIINTTINSRDYDIWLDYSSNCTMTNTSMSTKGIVLTGELEHWNSHTIDISNTVNGKPIYYWKNTNGGVIPLGAGQIILANCTNVTVNNQNLSHPTTGIQVGFSSICTIINNIIDTNNWYSIRLYHSVGCTVINNTVSNSGRGIELVCSINCIITSNIVSNNGQGILLLYSVNCTITNNSCNTNYNGIYLYSSGTCVIANNSISNNINGIYLYSIFQYHSSNNTINDNIITNNVYGIYLYLSSNNIIYNNYFDNICNAYDNGNNTWNISKMAGKNIIDGIYLGGNYWHDYDGIDTNGDGIGDTMLPYNCNGNISYGGDYLPLVEPNYAPISNFTWMPSTPTINNDIQFISLSHDSDGSIVSWLWEFGDGKTSRKKNPIHVYNKEGIYEVNLTVWDNDGAMARATKLVTVIKPSKDYVAITFATKNKIINYSISTNFTFKAFASAFNYTYGFIEFVNATWLLENYDSNATINASYGKSIIFNSGWNDGIAILQATYNGTNYNITFSINHSLFTFMLYKGWNFITLPCINDYNTSSLYENISGCSIILIWNATAQQFDVYVPHAPHDYVIEDGKGYFIAVEYDTIFSLEDLPIESVAIHLYVGWNAIGWFNETPTKASSLYTKINGSIILLKWNASSQDFMTYVPQAPDFSIYRGEAVLIAVNQESIWHGEG